MFLSSGCWQSIGRELYELDVSMRDVTNPQVGTVFFLLYFLCRFKEAYHFIRHKVNGNYRKQIRISLIRTFKNIQLSMDGQSLLRRLRADPKVSEIVVKHCTPTVRSPLGII